MKIYIRNIAYAVAALILGVSAVSCLEKYPASSIPEENAMQTFNDAEQHVNGIYASLKNPYLYSGLLTLLPDIQSDMVYAVEGNTNTYGSFWRWDFRPSATEIEGVYGSLYTVIGNCNFFLDRVDELMNRMTDDYYIDELEIYTGEVYTIRAMCYSELLKCYCKAYDPATADSTPGVVLRTKYFESEPIVRASLKDSYAFVLADLERAEKRLSDDDDHNLASSAFMTLATAQALHARVALYMQDWDEAIKYATKVIDRTNCFELASVRDTSTPDGASWFDYMWAYDASYEVIWRIGYTATSYGGALGQVFLNFTADYTYFYPDYVPAASVLNSFESGDERDDSYFANVNIGYSNGLNWPVLVKYYGNRSLISNYIYHVNMPKPFRLAEQYLIRAEAYCRKSQWSKAVEDLSTLRRARFSTGGTITVNENNWLRTIADERMKELYMEGFRLQDLKRWGEEYARINNGYSISRTPQQLSQSEGSSLKITADDARFVWPIPQHEIEAPGSQLVPNESNR